MIKFAHIRTLNKVGHLSSPHGGTTYAYELDNDNNVIGYAIAKCHEKDNFCKRVGRIKAEGRMKSKKYFHACKMSKENFFELINPF